MKLGLSGALTRATIRSPLTPLFLLAAIALGLLALMQIPREEEPQISVPMVDIRVAVPGLAAPDAVELAGKPLEAVVRALDGVEHIYTQAEDDGILLTARFRVGTDPDAAAVRVHEKLRAHWDRIPAGVAEPLVTVRGINDVPIVVLTLSPRPREAGRWNAATLRDMAERLRSELAKVDDVGLTFVTGGAPQIIRIAPDPARLALHGVPVAALADGVGQANRAFPDGTAREEGQSLSVSTGRTLTGASEVAMLRVAAASGAPVYVRDVANVTEQPQEVQTKVTRWARTDRTWRSAPAVSIAVAKRAGANAVTLADAVLARAAQLEGSLLPAGLEMAVTRNYGETANEKANELLFHLGLATLSIVMLIGVAIGWREAAVTAIVIPTTILLTLFAANLMGYTINRVSLFALIFSIGILVDDAIVMIENIARHWAMDNGRSRVDAAIAAVSEVGNPTVVATLTVVAALLPMLFVSGLMGPYMAPIPINASAAMIFSFFVAVVIAPWLMLRFARQAAAHGPHAAAGGGKLGALYARIARPIVASRRNAWLFLAAVGVATLAACSMFYFQLVTVKLLPFDNKSEVQVVIDLPEGATLEATARTAEQVAGMARTLPEVSAMELYAGASAPFNFNGLVRHYFLRDRAEQGDVLITLLPKSERSRSSHAVALALREKLKGIALPAGGSLKVVETPPGPPVLATLLAEIYGPTAEIRRATAAELETLFRSVPYIVDVDTSYGAPRPRLRFVPDRAKLDYYGLSERELYGSIGLLLGSTTLGYAQRGDGRTPLPIVLELPQASRRWDATLAAAPVAVARSAGAGRLVELGEVMDVRREAGSPIIFRRNGRAAEMVTGELAGSFEAPVYGMLAVQRAIDAHDWAAKGLEAPRISLHGQPEDERRVTLLWDGEWEITWVTFRDMGAAFGAALLGIYFLVVAQFGSFRLPLVILTPIPLTLVGIVLGHMLFDAPFTATSMIGFIALAGIIVRNSILLVDFIRHAGGEGKPLRETLIEAGSIRFKPILLTALAAMIGAAVILTDPIFQGLAISLLFGLASSTLLTVLVIPAIYVVLRDDARLAREGGAQ